MKLKDICEELSSPTAKEKYRELAKKYHPDMPQGSQSIIRNVNNAKDAGDKELLTLYQKLTGRKINIPLSIQEIGDTQNEWAKDIEQKKSEKYWIYEIFSDVKDGSIVITIRFRWDTHYTIVIKDGQNYKTKEMFIKVVRDRIEKKVELQKKKYNKEAGGEMYSLKKKQAKRRRKANLKGLKIPKYY